MAENIPESWRAVLDPVLSTPEARRLGEWLRGQEDAGRIIYPPRGQRLAALALTPLEGVKVVILGQDPYHGPGQAHGLAFSVLPGIAPPPSLVNIFKELHADLGLPRPGHGHLESWARAGVLLLNTCLTVERGQAGSHAGQGWETITDAIVAAVAARAPPAVFMLWGAHAQGKAQKLAALRDATHHLLIKSPHPSPLSAHRGFFGSKPFSRANAFLAAAKRDVVDWRL